MHKYSSSVSIAVVFFVCCCQCSQIRSVSTVRNVVIIGSGPAGCTSAIYSARALLEPLVVAGYIPGGQLTLTSDVENFPGYPDPVPGPKIMDDLTEQAKKFGAEFWNVDCNKLDLSCYPFKLHLPNCTVETRSIILATGAESLWLGAENEDNYKGTGISTCATCDGYLFRDKDVIVVGGGDSAMEEADFLSRLAKSVSVVHRRDSFGKASKVMEKRVLQNRNIKTLMNFKVNRWLGNGKTLRGAELQSTADGSTQEVSCSGAFIAIGHKPKTDFLDNQVELDSDRYVKVSGQYMTNVPGVFACGDVVDKHYRQAITAAGSGCQAAMNTEKWLMGSRESTCKCDTRGCS